MFPEIVIPQLYCPFLPNISPYVQAVETHTTQWAGAFNLYEGKHFDTYRAAKFGYMTCRFYPTADYERLCNTNDLLVLLFLLDDLFDHEESIRSAGDVQMLMSRCLTVLKDNHHYNIQTGRGILAALSDVWSRVIEKSSKIFQREFIEDILLLFKSIEWQMKNAKTWATPTIDEYIHWRPLIGGAHIAGRLIMFAENIHLTASIQRNPTIQQLNTLCGHLGCWANDLFSLGKEVEHGDVHNLVLVLQKMKNISLDAAIHETVALHNAEMAAFLELYNSLRHFPGAAGKTVRKYAYDLSMIIRGNIDWSIEDTKRYER
jgi:hypothetical protein